MLQINPYVIDSMIVVGFVTRWNEGPHCMRMINRNWGKFRTISDDGGLLPRLFRDCVGNEGFLECRILVVYVVSKNFIY